MTRCGWLFLAHLALFAIPAIAAAQEPSAEETSAEGTSADEIARCEDFGLDDAEVTARIHDIRGRIAHHEPDMRHWLTAFAVLQGALLVGQLVLAFTASSDDARWDSIIGAISSGLGVGTLFTSYPPLLGAGGTLDAMPEDTPEQRLAKLVRAEQLFRQSAEAVSFVRGPLASLASAAYVVAAASVLVGLGRTTGAYVLAAGGVVLGQGRLLVHPDGILHEWRRYRFVHADAGCAPPSAPTSPSVAWRLAPAAMPGGGGLGLSLTF